jgi:septal ring factor EnvC (AmiA/AmiB activator)
MQEEEAKNQGLMEQLRKNEKEHARLLQTLDAMKAEAQVLQAKFRETKRELFDAEARHADLVSAPRLSCILCLCPPVELTLEVWGVVT